MNHVFVGITQLQYIVSQKIKIVQFGVVLLRVNIISLVPSVAHF